MRKEMIYQADRKIEILETGTCFGLLYYILNLGTHPTAYVRIPKNNKFYGKEIKIIEKFIKYIGEDQKRAILYVLSLVIALFVTIFKIP